MLDRAMTTPYRIAAVAGVASGLVLLVNAAKRAELIASTSVTQLLAPLAEVFALLLVTGLFVRYGRRAGVFGLVAFLVNFVSLAALVGAEFVTNLVFAQLPAATITDLLAGPLGVALLLASMLFLVGTLAYCAWLATLRVVPRVALALYAVGAVPVALRAVVPETVLDTALVVLSTGVVWLAVWLWRDTRPQQVQHTAPATTDGRR